MHDMATKRAQPPEGSAAAIRAVDERPKVPTRREYTADYKLRILRELEAARESGEKGAMGALLRREGLTWVKVQRWRDALDRGGAGALAPKKAGRPRKHDPLTVENELLKKQNARLQEKLRKAEIIIDVQKNGRIAAPRFSTRLPPVGPETGDALHRPRPGGAAVSFLETTAIP
jgi:transposase-like protein